MKFLGQLPGAFPLRYGENPHERAYVYGDLMFELLHEGKQISYNNILDADAAWTTATFLKTLPYYGAVVVKHQTPCGVAIANSPEEAVKKAIEADAESSYGGILAINFKLTLNVVKSYKKYLEVIVAPEFESDVVEYLKKRKVRLIKPRDYLPLNGRTAFGGLIVSERVLPPLEFNLRVGESLSEKALIDLKLAFIVSESTKSNGIVIVKNGKTIGIGTGQPSRKRAAIIATMLAREKAQNAVASSDGFFPFADGLEILANAGVKAIVAPLGSKRDGEVLKMAEKLGITFYEAPSRVFRH